jgi:hypothetical protein
MFLDFYIGRRRRDWTAAPGVAHQFCQRLELISVKVAISQHFKIRYNFVRCAVVLFKVVFFTRLITFYPSLFLGKTIICTTPIALEDTPTSGQRTVLSQVLYISFTLHVLPSK